MAKIKTTPCNDFVRDQMQRFKKYFKEGTNDSKRELKRALYDKKDLSERQKDELWKKITQG